MARSLIDYEFGFYNIDLVKKVGNGCCVSNCVEKLKKYADFESCSNEEKGVEQVLKKYLGDV